MTELCHSIGAITEPICCHSIGAITESICCHSIGAITESICCLLSVVVLAYSLLYTRRP